LQACHDLIALVAVYRIQCRLEKETVAAILDVGDDPLFHRGHGVVRIFLLRHQLVALPVAALSIEHESEDVGVLAPAPAEVDAPDGGGLAVGHGAEDRAVALDGRGAQRGCVPMLGETQPGNQLVAQALAFFLVGVD